MHRRIPHFDIIRFTLVSGVKLFCASFEKIKVSSIIIIYVLYLVTILFYVFTSICIFRYFDTCLRLLIFTYVNFVLLITFAHVNYIVWNKTFCSNYIISVSRKFFFFNIINCADFFNFCNIVTLLLLCFFVFL